MSGDKSSVHEEEESEVLKNANPINNEKFKYLTHCEIDDNN